MKKRLLLFSLSLLVGIAFILFVAEILVLRNQGIVSPYVDLTAFAPEIAPSESISGKITSLTGKVMWESRMATVAAQIYAPIQLQQGEELQTGDNGVVKAQFDSVCKMVISPKSDVSIVQTLPANFVFLQTMGTVEYERLSSIPLSIRALHLLIDESNGDIVVGVDNDAKMVTIETKTTPVTIAYNDNNLTSHMETIAKGVTVQFDDGKRIIEN